jgi:hypothetical protein
MLFLGAADEAAGHQAIAASFLYGERAQSLYAQAREDGRGESWSTSGCCANSKRKARQRQGQSRTARPTGEWEASI